MAVTKTPRKKPVSTTEKGEEAVPKTKVAPTKKAAVKKAEPKPVEPNVAERLDLRNRKHGPTYPGGTVTYAVSERSPAIHLVVLRLVIR